MDKLLRKKPKRPKEEDCLLSEKTDQKRDGKRSTGRRVTEKNELEPS